MLAGISTDYYIRLEQGRERRPSRTVIDGLSAALLLEPAAANYLGELATAGETGESGERLGQERLGALQRLLDSFAVPAILVDRWLNVAADNSLGELLYDGLEHRRQASSARIARGCWSRPRLLVSKVWAP